MFAISSLLLTALLSAPAQTPSANAVTPALKRQVRALLDDYAHKNIPGIMAMLDEGPVLFMGTGESEVAPSRASIRRFLSNDFKLWDSSQFGAYSDFFVRCSGDMASAFLDVPWQAAENGKTRRFTIRLATVWHRSAHGWKLMQMLNAVPGSG